MPKQRKSYPFGRGNPFGFADWLNQLDAITDYDWRRQRPLEFWQRQYSVGAPTFGWAVVYHSETNA